MNTYYTYAYLREDGTPYYIGKGRNRRAYKPHKRGNIDIKPPKNRILFLKKNLTENEAIKHEIYMIFVFGRKDNNSGILRNLTDGGEGPGSGRIFSEESKKKISNSKKGRSFNLKKYNVIDVNGNNHIVFNGLKNFCLQNNISYDTMYYGLHFRNGNCTNGWKIKYFK
jgi:hypothetical protein